MANNSVPYEIIAAPFTVWAAPVGTAFPAVNAAPAVAWIKIGTAGDLNYDEDGVTVAHSQAMEIFRSLGDSGPRKVFRTEEDLKISLMLTDVTLENYKHAMNGNAVTDVAAGAGTAGYRWIGLSRGFSVDTVALLVRGPSPYMDAGNMQYQVPRAAQSGNPEIVWRKDKPAGLQLQWTALVDPGAATELERFGRLVAQDALPA